MLESKHFRPGVKWISTEITPEDPERARAWRNGPVYRKWLNGLVDFAMSPKGQALLKELKARDGRA